MKSQRSDTEKKHLIQEGKKSIDKIIRQNANVIILSNVQKIQKT